MHNRTPPSPHAPDFPAGTSAHKTGYGFKAPLQHFLERCHAEFATDHSGALADYIPELTRADPAHFGISSLMCTPGILVGMLLNGPP